MECVLTVPRDFREKRVVTTRLADEVAELTGAVHSASHVAVLDELVDVLYYLERLRALHGITHQQMAEYSAQKGESRQSYGKSKERELKLAAAVLSGHHSTPASVLSFSEKVGKDGQENRS